MMSAKSSPNSGRDSMIWSISIGFMVGLTSILLFDYQNDNGKF